MPGGYLHWKYLIDRGHPVSRPVASGYRLDNQGAQRGRDVGLPTHAHSVFSIHQGSTVLATSFLVPGRRNLPQYPWLYRSPTGMAYSIWLLQTIIPQHQRTLQPLNIVFLDIKSFDSVSHESLTDYKEDGSSSPHAGLSGQALPRRLDYPTHWHKQ